MKTLFGPLALLISLSALNAQGFSVTPYGPSCGPTASGVVEPVGSTWRFAFTVTGGVPKAYVLNFVGVAPQAIPIEFGFPCLLLTDIAFAQVHELDHAGSYTWSHAVPGGFAGHAFVQFAEFRFTSEGQFLVRTTNGLHMAPR
ncbi:MAG: hypothetical protein HZB39_04815 [Planctomycetes bacterium]|nr:hypothetical protein [Planctomycetota bacterium]